MKTSYVIGALAAGGLIFGAGAIIVGEKHLATKINDNVQTNITKFNASQKVLHVNIDSYESGLFNQSYKTSITANNRKILGVNFDISHGIGAVFSGNADLKGQVDVEAQVATVLGLNNNTIANLTGSSSGNKIELSADVVAIKPKSLGESLSISSFKIGGSADMVSNDIGAGSFYIKDLKVNALPKAILPIIPVTNVKVDLDNFSTDFSFANNQIKAQKVNFNFPEIFVSDYADIKGTRANLDLKIESDRLSKVFDFNVDKLDILSQSISSGPKDNIRISVKTSANMPFSTGSVESLLNIGQLLTPTKETKEFWQKGIAYKVDKFEVSYPNSKLVVSGDLNVAKVDSAKKFSFANYSTLNANVDATGDIALKLLESIPNAATSKDFKVNLVYKDGKATTNPVIAEFNSAIGTMVDQLDLSFGFTEPTIQNIQAPGIQIPQGNVASQLPTQPQPQQQTPVVQNVTVPQAVQPVNNVQQQVVVQPPVQQQAVPPQPSLQK